MAFTTASVCRQRSFPRSGDSAYMAMSRDELRRQLQESLGLGDAPKPKAPKATAVVQSNGDNPFSRRRAAKVAEPVEVNGDTAVAVADDEPESVSHETHSNDEPDTTPVEDFVDAVTGLVDYIADHRTALKEFLLGLR